MLGEIQVPSVIITPAVIGVASVVPEAASAAGLLGGGVRMVVILVIFRPAYLYRFSRDIPILALNHEFTISCGGVPILEDAAIFRFADFVLFCSRRYFLVLSASCTYRQLGCCVAAINSPPQAMN